jgi:small-conductance mechanosensitive channel
MKQILKDGKFTITGFVLAIAYVIIYFTVIVKISLEWMLGGLLIVIIVIFAFPMIGLTIDDLVMIKKGK